MAIATVLNAQSIFWEPVGIGQVKVQPDGKILLAGKFDTIDGSAARRLKRVNADGTPDGTFVPPPLEGWQDINAIRVQGDGTILVAGWSTNGLIRLRSEGTLDSTFQPPAMFASMGMDGVQGFGMQPDGRIVFWGQVGHVEATTLNGLGRLYPDGHLDVDFHPQLRLRGFEGKPEALVVQLDGKIVIAGQFDEVEGVPRPGVARLNKDGSLDQGFVPESVDGFVPRVYAVQNDMKIIAMGALGLCRLNIDGSTDAAFNPGLGLRGRDLWADPYLIRAVVLQPDDKPLVGGPFESYDGVPRKGLVRINEDGSPDTEFNVSLRLAFENESYRVSVSAMDIQQDGRIVLAGLFTTANGLGRSWLARVFPDGRLDQTLNAFQPTLTQPSLPSPTQIAFRVYGERGRPYRVEFSPDLVQWTAGRNLIITGDYFEFIAAKPAQPPQLFYRVTSL